MDVRAVALQVAARRLLAMRDERLLAVALERLARMRQTSRFTVSLAGSGGLNYDPNDEGNIVVADGIAAFLDRAPVRQTTFPIDKMHAIQPECEIDILERILRDRHPSQELPVLVSWRGRSYIRDGHHRILAQKLLGETRMPVLWISAEKAVPESD